LAHKARCFRFPFPPYIDIFLKLRLHHHWPPTWPATSPAQQTWIWTWTKHLAGALRRPAGPARATYPGCRPPCSSARTDGLAPVIQRTRTNAMNNSKPKASLPHKKNADKSVVTTCQQACGAVLTQGTGKKPSWALQTTRYPRRALIRRACCSTAFSAAGRYHSVNGVIAGWTNPAAHARRLRLPHSIGPGHRQGANRDIRAIRP
jgi:hypothetical protein